MTIIQRRTILGLALVSLAAAGGYLLMSANYFRIGFPLDDAWIHQTYARNLAETGQWAFIPGQVSAGSTSPLWSALLALGHWTGDPPYIWTYLLGAVCLAGLTVCGEMVYRGQTDLKIGGFPWVGALLGLEWHLVWAAVSGMETGLYAFWILAFFCLLLAKRKHWLVIGLLAGGAVWIRPDGLTLIGPALFTAAFTFLIWKERTKAIGLILGGFLMLFIPYLGFNRMLSGEWWPNTLFAKQAEYAILLQQPLLTRLVPLLSLPLVGAGALLLPGAAMAIILAVKRRKWALLSAFLWWLGITGVYALRLPVIYQHGRYLIPAMPIFLLLGAIGMRYLLERLHSKGQIITRVLARVWVLSTILVCAGFYVMGGISYAKDVAIIESEMVDTARWIEIHTEPQAVIAVHDIGAVGYFSHRQIIDLAGLISPEVIPFIRDENRLAEFIDQKGATYLVTFPGWYPILTRNAPILFRSEGKYSPQQGGENMAVYWWKAP